MARERIERARRRLEELRRGRTTPRSTPAKRDDPRPGVVSLGDAVEGGRRPAPAKPAPAAPKRDSVAGRLQSLRGRREAKPQHPAPAPRPQRKVTGPGALSAAGAVISAGGRRVGEGWQSVPTTTRVRIAAFAIVAALVALVWFVVVPAAPCAAPGGDECPPEDEAISLVPTDALAYLHLDVDPESDQYRSAAAIAERAPLLSRLAIGSVSTLAGARVDYTADIEPWAGGELALTVLPGSGGLFQVLMVEVDDAEGAREFSEELVGRGATTTEVGGSDLIVGARGAAATQSDGFLLVGEEGSLRSFLEAPDDAETLSEGEAGEMLDELPDARLASVYLSALGARTLLAGDTAFRSFDTFVDAGATDGVAAAVTADDDSLELSIRSRLDSERIEASPSFFATLPAFEPGLVADVGAEALAYLGLGAPGTSIEALLRRAAADAPGLLGAFNRVEEDLRREGGISVTDDILALLGSEAAVAVQPTGGGRAEGTAPGVLVNSGVPFLSVLADGVDADSAAKALAQLQEPLIGALDPLGSAKVAAFDTIEVAGIEAQSLVVNPDVELTYATYDDRLVVATNPLGVEEARTGGEGLAGAERFQAVTEGLPEEVSLLAYLDLRGLLAIGEQIGLAGDPVYARFAQDLRVLDSSALAVVASETEISTDLHLVVGEPDPVGDDAPPVTGE